MNEISNPRVGLFVTCLVDLYRPNIGYSAVKLLEDAGCRVEVAMGATCCGQPAYNSGDRKTTRDLARILIEAYEGFDYLVLPSGSCGGMIKKHYPELFETGDPWRARAQALADKCFELISFLVDVRGVEKVRAHYPGKVTYHDSCSGLREMKVKQQPRKLLAGVEGLTLAELKGAEECCGFGGTFSVKYGDISGRIVEDKATDIVSTGADTILAGDLGCLMNISGKLTRLGAKVKVRHVAEVLAGMAQGPAIGEGSE